MGDLPHAVLFACGMNSVRSPMAEGIMKFLFGRQVYVDSVGVRMQEVDPFTVAVMDEIGIDLSRHYPKTFICPDPAPSSPAKTSASRSSRPATTRASSVPS